MKVCLFMGDEFMKRSIVLLAPGYEELEAVTIVDVLRRADVSVDVVSVENTKLVMGAHGLKIEATRMLEDVAHDAVADLIVLPGGGPGAERLREHLGVHELIKKYQKEGAFIGAICAAPTVLAGAIDINGKRLTCYPGCEGALETAGAQLMQNEDVVVDGSLITGRGPGAAISFSIQLVETLLGSEKAISVKRGLYANR